MTPEPAGYTWPWLRSINRMSLDSEPWTAAVLCRYGSEPWTAAVLCRYGSEPWTAAVLCRYGSEPWTAAVLLHYSSAPWIAPAAPTNLQSRRRQETSQRACVFNTESWKYKAFLLFPCLSFSSACFKMLAEQDRITSLTWKTSSYQQTTTFILWLS